MNALVLGGTGFIGRHTVAALRARGHLVHIGTRAPRRPVHRLDPALRDCPRREVHVERLRHAGAWAGLLAGIDVVVNCVGILRPRGSQTYARVHTDAPAALAKACARARIRLIHVSALGLDACSRSGFITSKRAGEAAVRASGADYAIVRPSLLDGPGGFGARWLRRLARAPIHLVPADATGAIAALDVGDLGCALAAICELPTLADAREIELGGSCARDIGAYLAALRAAAGARTPAVCLRVPRWVALPAAWLCDLLHLSPYSRGHLELLARDNVPRPNALPVLLGRAPTPVGVAPSGAAARSPSAVAVPVER